MSFPRFDLIGSAGTFYRGNRGPLRDAMLAESVEPQDRGKVFGFHRAGDATGAVVGPLAAYALPSMANSHPATMQTVLAWLPGLSTAQVGEQDGAATFAACCVRASITCRSICERRGGERLTKSLCIGPHFETRAISSVSLRVAPNLLTHSPRPARY